MPLTNKGVGESENCQRIVGVGKSSLTLRQFSDDFLTFQQFSDMFFLSEANDDGESAPLGFHSTVVRLIFRHYLIISNSS